MKSGRLARSGRLAVVAVVTLGALAVTGCGTSSDDAEPAASSTPESVLQVVRDYQEGILLQDGELVCDQLTGEAQRSVIEDVAPFGNDPDCANAWGEVFDLVGEDEFARIEESQQELASADVEVNGTAASAALTDGRELRLEHAGDRWYISDTDATDSASEPEESVELDLNTGKVERLIGDALSSSPWHGAGAVECPPSATVEPGDTINCIAYGTDEGAQIVTVEIVNADGDGEIVEIERALPY